jgi:hypothetical protein
MKIEASCPEWWDKTLCERVTSDGVVHYGPALVFSLTIHSDGTAEADADVYDGVSAGGKVKFDLYCVDEAMAQLVFPTPVAFVTGIYIDIGTNCEAVTVHYLPVQP